MTNLLFDTISAAQAYAFKQQAQEGFWRGHIRSNNTIEAEYLFTSYFLGKKDDPINRKLVQQILDCQNQDGTWNIYFDAPGELSTTIECYFALKLFGINDHEPNQKKAKEFILSQGGLNKARIFTKIWLALFGQWSWEYIPTLPPEVILLPQWFPGNIYHFSSWARTAIVPLSIVLTYSPICKLPDNINLKDLFVNDSSNPIQHPKQRIISQFLNTSLLIYEKYHAKNLREKALEQATNWIIEHFEADGTQGGIAVGWTYPLIAMLLRGYAPDHPLITQCLNGALQNYSYQTDSALQLDCTNSPVWDTCLMINALFDSNITADHPAIEKGVDYLIKNQILNGGDWQINNKDSKPGGWCFEFSNSNYPDVDDTAEVLTALIKYQEKINSTSTACSEAISSGMKWLLSMQSKNGGWAAFDKNNTQQFLTQLSFFDFGDILDPPSVDVTGHVLETLGAFGFDVQDDIIKKAIKFIFNEQEQEGCWFGRWGVNYIYGTCSVLMGLEAIHYPMNDPKLQKTKEWLLHKQNLDGGWGESCSSYSHLEDRGQGPSTASQTAWALMALMTFETLPKEAIEKGITYLCDTFTGETWEEPYFTGTGFSGYLSGDSNIANGLHQGKELSSGFMLRYDLYRHYWPLRAIGLYLKKFSKH